MNPNIAARQLAMNIRFGAPSGAAEMFEPGSEGVLWWADYTDEARGRKAGGLLSRCQATETCPKIVETFGSAEFYSLRLSPNLVGTRADRDIPLPANVRRYYSPSIRHGGGQGGFNVDTPVDALLHAGGEPEPLVRQQPRADACAGGLGRQGCAAAAQPLPAPRPRRPGAADAGGAWASRSIPGVSLPDGVFVPLYDYDFGPGFRNADVSGVVSLQPPVVRQTLPALVPRVDADGNEIAGVRSVLLEAPLGTYTGWNPVARGFFKGQIQALGGGYIPFAKTKARAARRRRSRACRSRSATCNHEGYVARVKAAAARAVAERFLLQDDADRIVAQAEKSAVPAVANADF